MKSSSKGPDDSKMIEEVSSSENDGEVSLNCNFLPNVFELDSK